MATERPVPGKSAASRLEYVRHAAVEALDHMQRHDIAPTPDSFAVWFAYVVGEIGGLRRVIDVLLTNKRSIDDTQCAELFARFILPGYRDRAIEDIAEGLGDVTGDLERTLGEAGSGANRLGRALSTASTALASAANEGEVRNLIDTLLMTTESAQNANEALKAELATTTGEIAALRVKLEESRQEAMTDGLTGIANRKRFDVTLMEAASDAMETGTSMTLLMLDIDHFKHFNDTHGHVLGDQVLRLVGRTLTECVRAGDTAARYGGEEFAVILPRTEMEVARQVAERIRKRLHQKHIIRRNTGEDLGVVTISIGVARYTYGEAMASLVNRADETLYRAKETGRDRVLIEGE